MRAAISRMTLVFCPLPHAGMPEHSFHCSYMFIELADGTQELWHEPPTDVIDNVYLGVIAERLVHPCLRDSEHVWERSQ